MGERFRCRSFEWCFTSRGHGESRRRTIRGRNWRCALWTYDTIDSGRRAPEDIPEEKRAAVVVALDPSGAAGRDDLGADEIGIVVAARGFDGDCYVLADLSCREAPAVWGRRAVTAFHEFRADCIVAESNFGGEMVRATIQAADRNAPVRLVTASRGKAVRAEPMSVRYAQGQVHHVGRKGIEEMASPLGAREQSPEELARLVRDAEAFKLALSLLSPEDGPSKGLMLLRKAYQAISDRAECAEREADGLREELAHLKQAKKK